MKLNLFDVLDYFGRESFIIIKTINYSFSNDFFFLDDYK